MTDNPFEEYVVNNLTLSVIGANMTLINLTGYTDFVIERSDDITNEAQMGEIINEIRETSIDALFEMESLKSSLDRFLFSYEDVENPLDMLKRETACNTVRDINNSSLFTRIKMLFIPPSQVKPKIRFQDRVPIPKNKNEIDVCIGDMDDI